MQIRNGFTISTIVQSRNVGLILQKICIVMAGLRLHYNRAMLWASYYQPKIPGTKMRTNYFNWKQGGKKIY